MISDPQKGITIQYNHLDLPDLITWTDGRRMELLYDANGTLHRRELFDENNNSIQKHEYLGQLGYLDVYKYAVMHSQGRMVNEGLEGYLEYIYLDHAQKTDGLFEAQQIESTGNIIDESTQYQASQCITFEDGFEVFPDATFDANVEPPPTYTEDWRYEWNITDHLGNLKIVYTGPNSSNLTILQQQDFFAYGMPRDKNLTTSLENKYQFNGIDHVNEFGLDWDMASFRSLDAAIGICNDGEKRFASSGSVCVCV